MLSSDGTLISATCITPEAAEYLLSNSELLPEHVASREVLAGTVQTLLYDCGRLRMRMVKANKLVEKLGLIVEIVGQWIDNGGLGRMDEDEGGRRLSWDGLMVQNGQRRSDRVTVGRHGGDISNRVAV